MFVDPSKYFKRVSLNPATQVDIHPSAEDILYIKESIIAATSTGAALRWSRRRYKLRNRKERERKGKRESSKSQLNARSVYFRLDGNKGATEISYGFGISTKSEPTLS